MILEGQIKWIRIGQENYRHYSNINIGQNVHNTKFWTQYGKKIRDYSRSQNVAWKIPEGVGRGIVYVDMCWNEVSDKHPGTEVF